MSVIFLVGWGPLPAPQDDGGGGQVSDCCELCSRSPSSCPHIRSWGPPAARQHQHQRRPQQSGLLEMGSGEMNGVRVWVRQSMVKSAVALLEKKGKKKV